MAKDKKEEEESSKEVIKDEAYFEKLEKESKEPKAESEISNEK